MQEAADNRGVGLIGHGLVGRAGPELDRDPDIGEARRIEREAEARSGDDGGGDAGIVSPGRRRSSGARRGRDHDRAHELGLARAMAGDAREIGDAADRDQGGGGSRRKAENPHPVGAQARMARPSCEHEIDDLADVPRAVRQPLRPPDTAHILEIVARMHRHDDHEARPGQRLRGVDMAGHAGAGAVRNDDKGERTAADGGEDRDRDRWMAGIVHLRLLERDLRRGGGRRLRGDRLRQGHRKSGKRRNKAQESH